MSILQHQSSGTLRAFAAIAMIVVTPALTPSIAGAQGLESDRPDVTEVASVVRRLQIESGYTFTRAADTDLHTFGELLFRIGMTRNAELRIEANSFMVERLRNSGTSSSGISDVGLGMKVHLMDAPSAAVIFGASLPTGSGPGDGGAVSPEIVAVLEPSLGSERIGAGFNLGVTSEETAGERQTLLFGSAVLGLDVAPRTGVYLESFFNQRLGGAATPGPGRSIGFDGGMTYSLSADLQLDARVGGVVEGPAEWFFGVGLVRRIR